MGNVIVSGKLMLQLMGSPVAASADILSPAAVKQIVVSDAACLHKLRTDIIILGRLQRKRSKPDDRLSRSLNEPVGKVAALGVDEISFHKMRQHIGRTAGSLVRGKSVGVLGVHHRKPRQIALSRAAYLLVGLGI